MAADGIVLVTGGSRGIGAATATLLAGQGRRQRVVIVDVAPEPLAGTQVITWPGPVRMWRAESAVVSGIADIEAAHNDHRLGQRRRRVRQDAQDRARGMDQWDREVNIDLRGIVPSPAASAFEWRNDSADPSSMSPRLPV